VFIPLKKALKILLIVLILILVAAAALIIYLTITEFSPEAVESAEIVEQCSGESISVGDSIKILSFNTGYCALGEDADFFMDGGSGVRPDSAGTIMYNQTGIIDIIESENPDIIMLQEVDTSSKRSYGVDEAATYSEQLGLNSAYALNYSCDYVPYPLPTIGRVHSGLLTMSAYTFTDAERVALPCPFSWPVSVANLKRCLLVSRFELEGTDSELVIINLHLEAYDDGEGKIAQTKMLREYIESEYEKGNYVIAGGDFNQTFPGCTDVYPIEDADKWTPGVLEEDSLPDSWSFAFDSSTPTCRLLDAPHTSEDANQLYVIDGFIVSPNVELKSVTTLDEGFVYSDHNPVALVVTLK
jgi:endonuclease/exonuclease/phosphatase family metal-dependent hydrolase